MVYCTHRGLIYWALYEQGYSPVAVVDGIATMRIPV